ncbi:prevent-host-death family protein [Xylanimonas cellulosilytica DSM 15894]|uniref:Antitoxin n=1 Tax=Xylanimonas cellulosilytica (strain DSM 15894 / JCM 12276 / CECT 5975 / KCTC 9989 / LMG 20990 / NBRC 107835 / XIL07) TaxID=446471 RepID=D1BWD9_XYLCX|nr:type II toxin-antitoxin system Phd/YefM family antitoxin [Xylanimonas cellulosilytica]ACZ31484.1 prevent-host-death family protein [Xylanimonas cellulosilytica DSM 15894]
MSALTISEARATLPALLDRVEQGEEITITRHGKPVAVLVRPDLLRVRRSSAAFERADRIGRMLDEARRKPVHRGGLTSERAQEILDWVREGRDARP